MTMTVDADLTVATFAQTVRGELFDLDDEAVNDLTEGLEADLADKLADGDDLGDPIAYAAELRAAAGIGPRVRRTPITVLAKLRVALRAFVAAHAWARGLRDFLVSLRPVWWVLRAVVVLGLFNNDWQFSAIPLTGAHWLLLAALVVVSVQWGCGRWLPWRWSRGGVVVVSVLALLALPVIAQATYSRATWDPDPSNYVYGGLGYNGAIITNIFAYGADGEPLEDVRLFDQDGNPLTTAPDGVGGGPYFYTMDDQMLVPSSGVSGSAGWNVYPLRAITIGDIDLSGEILPTVTPTPVPVPFDAVQQLLGYEPPAVPTE